MADDDALSPDARLKTFLASALFVVPWFAWQAWVLGTSFSQRRGKLVADANAFAQTRVAQAALAAQRREAGEAPPPSDDVSAHAHALPGRSRPLLLVLGMGLLFLFSRAWLARVLAVVPEAYLDEIFHIPQAQTYCAGRYRDWDDKITTPPGLYLVSLVLRPLWGGSDGHGHADGCSVWALRAANNVAIMLVAIVVCSCRAALERQDQQRRQQRQRRRRHRGQQLAPSPESIFSLYAFHTAVNVALLPVLFFFSALYYTDVYATLSALLAYRWYLFRQQTDQDAQPPPQWTGLVTVLLGFVALLFRQTNVFWVAVYLGGLEGVQAVKAVRQRNTEALLRSAAAAAQPPAAAPTAAALWVLVQRYARQYALGAIHDPPVGDAWPDDGLVCLLSIAVAAVCNPVAVLQRVWPYVGLLAGFAAFGVWNGGVVLGDKANHVATVHLAQLLYLWPLFAFFSAPLVFAQGLRWALARVVTGRQATPEEERTVRPRPRPRPAITQATSAQSVLHRVFVDKAYHVFYLLAVPGLMGAIVHYNTIVHPFTLADNRHYMFYVFRYTIRRETVRYLLVPVYAVCAWACWRLLSGPGSSDGDRDNRDFVNSPFVAFVAFARIGDNHDDTETAAAKAAKDKTTAAAASEAQAPPAAPPPIFLSVLDEDGDAAASAAQTGAATSTALLWLLATALALSMAPLVEPRYFLLPWVFWRLLVPAVPTVRAALGGNDRPPLLQRLGQKIDDRLVLETAWFVTVNAATMYMFLYRPYVWRDETGHVLDDGRLQRFMW